MIQKHIPPSHSEDFTIWAKFRLSQFGRFRDEKTHTPLFSLSHFVSEDSTWNNPSALPHTKHPLITYVRKYEERTTTKFGEKICKIA